jgi:hypothetical protein
MWESEKKVHKVVVPKVKAGAHPISHTHTSTHAHTYTHIHIQQKHARGPTYMHGAGDGGGWLSPWLRGCRGGVTSACLRQRTARRLGGHRRLTPLPHPLGHSMRRGGLARVRGGPRLHGVQLPQPEGQ